MRSSRSVARSASGFRERGLREAFADEFRRGALPGRDEKGQQFIHRSIEQFAPFEERRARAFGAVPQPSLQIAACVPDKRRVCPQLVGDQVAKGEAAFVDEAMVFHPNDSALLKTAPGTSVPAVTGAAYFTNAIFPSTASAVMLSPLRKRMARISWESGSRMLRWTEAAIHAPVWRVRRWWQAGQKVEQR